MIPLTVELSPFTHMPCSIIYLTQIFSITSVIVLLNLVYIDIKTKMFVKQYLLGMLKKTHFMRVKSYAVTWYMYV